MNFGTRLTKLESASATGLQIVILYEGEPLPPSGNGLTVIVRKPGHRP